MKVLCFTPSYHRYKMIRGCIRDIQAQTYKEHDHAVNITLDNGEDKQSLSVFFDDLPKDKLFLGFNENKHNHWNSINAIKQAPQWRDYDLYIKIDDDDIYKSDYVNNIVNIFKSSNADIFSTKVKYYLKDTLLITNNSLYNNFGGNPPGTDYNMPFTFAFNNKAFKSILELGFPKIPDRITHGHDRIWRYKWEEDRLKHEEVNNRENIIWYVHGKNISTSDFLKR